MRLKFTQLLASVLSFFMIASLPISANQIQGYAIRNIHIVKSQNMLNDEEIIENAGFRKGGMIYPHTSQIQDATRKMTKMEQVRFATIYLSNINDQDHSADLIINLKMHPVMDEFFVEGIGSREKKELLNVIDIPKDSILSPLFLQKKQKEVQDFFIKKGFNKASVWLSLVPLASQDESKKLMIKIDKGQRYRINRIALKGHHYFQTDYLLYKLKPLQGSPRFTLVKDILKRLITLKPVRKNGILRQLPKSLDEVFCYFHSHVHLFSPIFKAQNYTQAKDRLVQLYRSKGFLDMKIIKENIEYTDQGEVNIAFKIQEGKQYTIRRIDWVGNHVYDQKTLYSLLKLDQNQIYDPVYIKKKLSPGHQETTIADLYTNNGYLFFQAEAIETGMVDHQVDLEIRIQEGKQVSINAVKITGNTLTHDYVIRRELTTLPGERFNRGQVLESLQNLALLDYFKPDKLHPNIELNEDRGTVDLTYHVQENPKFDCKFNGGYQSKIIFNLTLGSKNIALQNLFHRKRPIGGGQTLHLTASLQGKHQQRISFDFQEPWLWIKHKRYLGSIHANYSRQIIQNARDLFYQAMYAPSIPFTRLGYKKGIIHAKGLGFTFGKKIHKYWEGRIGLDYAYHDYKHIDIFGNHVKKTGGLHSVVLDLNLMHNSINHPHFPTDGWSWSNLFMWTPPYTLLGYATHNPKEIPPVKEFGKYMGDLSWFCKLPARFVLNLRGHVGLLYSLSKHPIGSFHRFHTEEKNSQVHDLLGRTFVPLRGYPDGSLTPQGAQKCLVGGVMYHKFVAELRYPIAYMPACIYLLGFFEMGGNWLEYSHYHPKSMFKSTGGGLRMILPIPMIPMLGIDFTYRLDSIHNIQDKLPKVGYNFVFGSSTR